MALNGLQNTVVVTNQYLWKNFLKFANQQAIPNIFWGSALLFNSDICVATISFLHKVFS